MISNHPEHSESISKTDSTPPSSSRKKSTDSQCSVIISKPGSLPGSLRQNSTDSQCVGNLSLDGKEFLEVLSQLRLEHEQFLDQLGRQVNSFLLSQERSSVGDRSASHSSTVPVNSSLHPHAVVDAALGGESDRATLNSSSLRPFVVEPSPSWNTLRITAASSATQSSSASPPLNDDWEENDDCTNSGEPASSLTMKPKPSFAKRRSKEVNSIAAQRRRDNTAAAKRSSVFVPDPHMVGPDTTTKSCLQRFVLSNRFDHISAALVLSNAAFIGVQVEFVFSGETPSMVSIVDYLFCIAFLVELGLRLYAFGCRGYFFVHETAWNWFDFSIVSMSTLDTVISLSLDGKTSPLGNISVLRVVRIVRITRVLRIIRVMRFFKDLRILIAAITSTLKTATWALLLLLISMYMFGIAIAQMTADYANEQRDVGTPLSDDVALLHYFGSLGTAIFTLFMTVAGGIDWEHAVSPLEALPLAMCVYIFFILFSSFCMMNVVTGIFVQNAIETFDGDKEKVIEFQLKDKKRFVDRLTELFMQVGQDGRCTKEEFEELCYDEHMRVLLRTLDIEPRDALALFAMMDTDGTGELNLDDFIHGCITLRGQAKAVHMERSLLESKASMQALTLMSKQMEEMNSKIDSKIGTTSTADFKRSGLSPSRGAGLVSQGVGLVPTPSLNGIDSARPRRPPETLPEELDLVEELSVIR